jgi:hypothetical protein
MGEQAGDEQREECSLQHLDLRILIRQKFTFQASKSGRVVSCDGIRIRSSQARLTLAIVDVAMVKVRRICCYTEHRLFISTGEMMRPCVLSPVANYSVALAFPLAFPLGPVGRQGRHYDSIA